MLRLIDCYDTDKKSDIHKRAICLVNLITVNRPSEMVRLKVSDFDLDNRAVNVMMVKQGENADIIVLENETLFDSRKFKAMNTEDSKIGSLMEDQFLSLLSYVADQERMKLLKRQAEGIAEGRKAGKHLGRPKLDLSTLSKEQREVLDANYEAWKRKELTGVKFMEMLGLKKNSFYKVLGEYGRGKCCATNIFIH